MKTRIARNVQSRNTSPLAYRVLKYASWLLVTIGIGISVSVLLADASSRPLCWSAACWRQAFTLFEIPFWLAVAGAAAFALAVAYQRWVTSLEQEETRLRQSEMVRYGAFRSEFFETLAYNLQDDQFQALSDLTAAKLFNSLYPNARNSDYHLNVEVERALDQDVPTTYDHLANVNQSDPSRYLASSYEPIHELYSTLRDPIGWDTDITFTYTDPLICGSLGESFARAAKDMLAIASAVNDFESKRFFDNSTRRAWKAAVRRLSESVEHANVLHDFWENLVVDRWYKALHSSDLEAAGRLDVLSRLGRLSTNEAARRYVYNTLTSEPSALPEDSRAQAASQLSVGFD